VVPVADVFSWLDRHAAGVGAAAGIATALIATAALVVAAFALRASRKAAQGSLDSARTAAAALETSIAPVLTFVGMTDGPEGSFNVEVQNVGNGPALNVHVLLAPYLDQGVLIVRLWAAKGLDKRPLPVGASTQVTVRRANPDLPADLPPVAEVLMLCEDVGGFAHYTYTRPGVSPYGPPTQVGKLPVDGEAAEFERWFDDYWRKHSGTA
jgi:hypothetical protein